MMTSIYRAILELEGAGQPGVLCTIISGRGSTPRHAGSKMLVYPDGKINGTIGGGELEHRVVTEALEALNQGKPRIVEYSMVDPVRGDPGVCGGQLEIFVEPIMPKLRLVIFGGGHVGKEVAHLGRWLGFYIAVCDERRDLCNPETIPDADAFHYDYMDDFEKKIEITPWTYVVMTTRNVDVDLQVLPHLLEKKSAYIGLIGSRRRWATTKGKLLEFGIPQEKIDFIRSPIGLRLNAETPREIAVSIMAEIIMLQKHGDGKPLKNLSQ